MKLAYIPNIITALRVLLIAPIIYYLHTGQYHMAFTYFLIAGISDALDGLLARRFGWMSRFGSIVDPIADKLLLVAGFIELAYLGVLPVWLTVVVIARDIWIILGATCYHFLIGKFDFKPSIISKSNTFFQIVLLSLVILNLAFHIVPHEVLVILIYLVLCTTIASFINYTLVWGHKAIKAHRQGKHDDN